MQQIFIIRDENGNITGLTGNPDEGAEATTIDDPAVQQFLFKLDIDLVRVVEDVIDLLVSRGIFRFTDLPDSAQQKLMFRKSLRSQWQSVPDPLGDEEGLF